MASTEGTTEGTNEAFQMAVALGAQTRRLSGGSFLKEEFVELDEDTTRRLQAWKYSRCHGGERAPPYDVRISLAARMIARPTKKIAKSEWLYKSSVRSRP